VVGQGGSLRPAPLAASALRVARDRPFRACGRSPHRPRPFRAKMYVPSTPAGIPVGCAPCGLSRSSALCRHRLSRATRRRAFSATVALDTDPRIGPDTSGHIPLAARSGRVGARCWLDGLPEARSRSRPGGAHEGASESAQMVLSVVVVRKPRCSGIAVSARERLRRKSPVVIPMSSNNATSK